MANTTDLISTIYDEVVRVLGLGDADGAHFVQMAWPGISLSPADFRRVDDPQGPVDADVVREAVSVLANIVPAFSKVRFESSGFDVDDVYEILLTSAIPGGATRDTIADDPVHRLFTDAQRELLQARRARHDDPNEFYYPCTASPAAWFDEAEDAGWTTIRLGPADVRPAAGSSSAFATSGGLELARAAAWRHKPVVADNAAIRHKLRGAALARPGPAKRPLAAATAAPAGTFVAAGRGLAPRDPTPDITDPSGQDTFAPAATPSSELGRGGLDIAGVDLLRRDLGVRDLARRLAVKNFFEHQAPALPASPTTDGFNVSFRACRVDLERPWLKPGLLAAKNWWMFDTPSGSYSTGTSDINPGMFPLLTTSFVAIRDLRISANWSTDDRKHLGNAASFGFFDLRNGVFKGNTVEVKGLQIIAWTSRVTPKLPPLSPP